MSTTPFNETSEGTMENPTDSQCLSSDLRKEILSSLFVDRSDSHGWVSQSIFASTQVCSTGLSKELVRRSLTNWPQLLKMLDSPKEC